MISIQINVQAADMQSAIDMYKAFQAAGIPAITLPTVTRGEHGENMKIALQEFNAKRLKPTSEEIKAGLQGESLAIHRLKQAGLAHKIVAFDASHEQEENSAHELPEGEEY
jgi:hypothetical protein